MLIVRGSVALRSQIIGIIKFNIIVYTNCEIYLPIFILKKRIDNADIKMRTAEHLRDNIYDCGYNEQKKISSNLFLI